jgi:hypothetical protein
MCLRATVFAIAATLGWLLPAASSESLAGRMRVGHGLSVVVPPGFHVTRRQFSSCIDPVERFSLISGRQVLTVQERLDPVREELTPRPPRFVVGGRPSPLECCSLPGRKGWVLEFSEHGRAFYAYVYPGDRSPAVLLAALDSFAVRA